MFLCLLAEVGEDGTGANLQVRALFLEFALDNGGGDGFVTGREATPSQ